MEREPLDVERENEDARDAAIIGADDTGMIGGERFIFDGETARANEETDASDADAPTAEG